MYSIVGKVFGPPAPIFENKKCCRRYSKIVDSISVSELAALF